MTEQPFTFIYRTETLERTSTKILFSVMKGVLQNWATEPWRYLSLPIFSGCSFDTILLLLHQWRKTVLLLLRSSNSFPVCVFSSINIFVSVDCPCVISFTLSNLQFQASWKFCMFFLCYHDQPSIIINFKTHILLIFYIMCRNYWCSTLSFLASY